MRDARYLPLKIAALCVVLIATERGSAQEQPLVVVDETRKETALPPGELRQLPRRTVTATMHGASHTFAGPLLADVLKRGGARFGELLRGERLAHYVLVEAADDYRVVFALPELDPAFRDRDIILADEQDGRPLPSDDGPLRIVVPDEQRGARSVRQVLRLRLMVAPK